MEVENLEYNTYLESKTTALSLDLTGDIYPDRCAKIELYINDSLEFQGTVYTVKRYKNGATIYVYNQLRNLKSRATGVYYYKKLSEIFNDICNKLGLSCTVVDTKYVIPYLFFENETYFDILSDAINQTKIMTGIEYTISVTNNKITLCNFLEKSDIYEVFDENMIYFEENATNENVINYVEVYQMSANSLYSKYIAKDDELIKYYGILSKSIKVNKGYSASECQRMAQSYLEGLQGEEHFVKIKVIADNLINVGDIIKINNHLYRVEEATLNISNDKDIYTLRLIFWRVYNGAL